MASRKLSEWSRINTAEIEEKVAKAAIKALLIPANNLQTVFENDHWWVANTDTGELWLVENAEGPGSTDGLALIKW